jgi:hypothetical protein
MDTSNLDTTNTILGIMAAVSVLEALVIIGVGVGGFILYRRVTTLLEDVEQRHIAPVRQKVDAILENVHSVAAHLNHQTERVDQAITGTMDRIDDTAARVKTTVRERLNQVVGMVYGVRAVLMSLLNGRHEPMSGRWQSANQ